MRPCPAPSGTAACRAHLPPSFFSILMVPGLRPVQGTTSQLACSSACAVAAGVATRHMRCPAQLRCPRQAGSWQLRFPPARHDGWVGAGGAARQVAEQRAGDRQVALGAAACAQLGKKLAWSLSAVAALLGTSCAEQSQTSVLQLRASSAPQRSATRAGSWRVPGSAQDTSSHCARGRCMRDSLLGAAAASPQHCVRRRSSSGSCRQQASPPRRAPARSRACTRTQRSQALPSANMAGLTPT